MSLKARENLRKNKTKTGGIVKTKKNENGKRKKVYFLHFLQLTVGLKLNSTKKRIFYWGILPLFDVKFAPKT